MDERNEIIEMALAVGKELWQRYLFPQIKFYCDLNGIEDTNTAVEAVRLWLNVHVSGRDAS